MPLLSLKDLTQALEVARRARRELPEGPQRSAMDEQIVSLMGHVNAIISEDDRLIRRRDAENKLLACAPSNVNLTMIKVAGDMTRLVAKVLTGVDPVEAWKQL